MTDHEIEDKRHESEGGVTAAFPEKAPPLYPVAPATSRRMTKNTLRSTLIPRACWSVGDICFDFDKAFVKKEPAQGHFRKLREILKEARAKVARLYDHATEAQLRSPITIFGHADPVGQDQYNKDLSENRAKAIYGVLTRNTNAWKEIFSEPEDATYLRERLSEAGAVGDTLDATVRNYMDMLCGKDFVLDEKDFLAEGKCAYQGCSEFNPVRMFSETQHRFYRKYKDKTEQEQKTEERNDENEPNRRVVAFIFMPGTTMNEAAWPCCRAKGGIAPCKQRFWADSRKRREYQKEGREYKRHGSPSGWTYKLTDDTFACRFYQRLAGEGPCDWIAKSLVRLGVEPAELRFHDLGFKCHLEMRELDGTYSNETPGILTIMKQSARDLYDNLKDQAQYCEPVQATKAAQILKGKTFKDYLQSVRGKLTHLVKVSYFRKSDGAAEIHILRAVVYDVRAKQPVELFRAQVSAPYVIGTHGRAKKTGRIVTRLRPGQDTGSLAGERRDGLDDKYDTLWKKLCGDHESLLRCLQKAMDEEVRAKLKQARTARGAQRRDA